jgi:hypothetical protein
VILRPTAKAANLLRVKPAATVEPGPGDWYLNIVWIDGRKNGLLAHAGTAFPIFVPDIRAGDLRPLGPWLRAAIITALADEDLPRGTLGDLGIGEPMIAKTANRQLLGFMTETAFRAKYEIDDAGGLGQTDFIALNRHLRRDLHNYSGRYATPIELITGRRR